MKSVRLLLVAVMLARASYASAGGIPVLDVSNLAQSTISALEAVQ